MGGRWGRGEGWGAVGRGGWGVEVSREKGSQVIRGGGRVGRGWWRVGGLGDEVVGLGGGGGGGWDIVGGWGAATVR